MELSKMIYRRKSTRKYKDEPVDLEIIQKIADFSKTLTPLYHDIKTYMEFVEKEKVKCLCPWTTPQVIAIYSEECDAYLENVGFMFQQLDLFLQEIGLGACWLGMGRMNDRNVSGNEKDGLKFVIMLAFGYTSGELYRKDLSEFNRNPISKISDIEDKRLEPARLAPSAVNSQPWYFVHDGEVIHTYCVKKGIFKQKSVWSMNRIDMGICLSHLYVENPETFKFFKSDAAEKLAGYEYIGSFTL